MFYSSGAIEDQWNKSYLRANRAIAGLGMAFWGTVSVGVLIVAALMLATHGFDQVEDYHQLPLMLIPVFGLWGFVLLIASLAFACLVAELRQGKPPRIVAIELGSTLWRAASAQDPGGGWRNSRQSWAASAMASRIGSPGTR